MRFLHAYSIRNGRAETGARLNPRGAKLPASSEAKHFDLAPASKNQGQIRHQQHHGIFDAVGHEESIVPMDGDDGYGHVKGEHDGDVPGQYAEDHGQPAEKLHRGEQDGGASGLRNARASQEFGHLLESHEEFLTTVGDKDHADGDAQQSNSPGTQQVRAVAHAPSLEYSGSLHSELKL